MYDTKHFRHLCSERTEKMKGSFQKFAGVLRGSVVECLTRNPGVLGSSRTGSPGFFRGSVLGQDTSEPQPSTGEFQEDVNNVNCGRDITEMQLKAT